MKPVNVIILALLVLSAGVAVWYNNKAVPSSSTNTGQALFPTLAGKLDSVTELSLRDAGGGAVTIVKKDGDWIVSEKSRYYADLAKVGQLTVATSEARLLEQKTANPEFYARLGVSDITNSDSEATLLSLTTSGQTYDVLVGNSSSRFGGSTFVRKPKDEISYLVSPALDASSDVDDWLDKQVFDIATDEVQSVRVTNASGKVTEVHKSAMFDTDFELVGRGEGQVLNDVAVRGLARGLTGLRFDDVKRGVAFAVNDYKRLSVTYTLFSGVVIDATLFYRDDDAQTASDGGSVKQPQFWFNAGARFDEAIAQQFVPQPSSENEDESSAERLMLTAADLADRRELVERINGTRKRWIYKITSARFDSMNRSADSLIASTE